jgi:transglutaminase-like putative cysteine protease
MAANPYQRNGYAFLMHIFGFVLLLEWVLPLRDVTDTANLYVFVVFLVISFALSFLQIIPLLSFLVHIGFMFYFLHILFLNETFLSKSWFSYLWNDISYNTGVIWSADWMAMTGLFRSLLLFILLWLVSYLVIYWILYRKQMLLFVVFTVTYVAILDTFTVYQGNWAIVRLIVVGLSIVGFVHLERLKEREGIYRNSKLLLGWGIPLIIFVLLSATAGYFSPKAAPLWPDPVPFLTGIGNGDGPGFGSGVRKIGYGENDSRLGGPFVPDDSVVFQAELTRTHYWRVETKDIYTGKGWGTSEGESVELSNGINDQVSWMTDSVETDTFTAKLTMEKTYPHVNYPLGLTDIEAENTIFKMDESTEKITTSDENGDSVSLEEYRVNYEFPRYYIEALKGAEPGTGEESDPEFMERYTQLPDSMPDRVNDLAEEITGSFPSRFDKVNAVERYFRNNGFTYETTEVAVPTGNEDYVDQFLFETMQGYCDNFSTSMVALLRAVDIPARWVKGFTQGEFVDVTDNSTRIFEVTNNNAHSWVEVYYPEVGWVTYEPTSGFSNPYRFVYQSVEENTGENNEDQMPEQQETPDLDRNETPEREEELEEGAAGGSNRNGGILNVELSWKRVLLFLGTLLGAALLIFFTSRKWMPYFYIARYKGKRDDGTFYKAYHALLRQLHSIGLVREEGQTLREYAKYIDSRYSTTEMQTLTANYERVLYRGDSSLQEWEKSVELWENLIKKASS